MFELFRVYQLSIMQTFAGVCTAMVFMLLFTKAISTKRRWILIGIELVAILLVSFDRLAYIYAGDAGHTGYVMVRVSNFMVFFMTAATVFVFNLYIIDLLKEEGQTGVVPWRLKIVGILSLLQMIFVIVSQFTHTIYTFDESNNYHRQPLFFLCYILPVVGPLIQFSVICQYRKRFSRFIRFSLFLFIIAPIVASVIQFFAYGISLTNVVIAIVCMFMYIFQYLDINEKIENAARIEREFLKGQTLEARKLFEQTAQSIARLVDLKDKNAEGHSLKVAEYAKKIAEDAGKSEEECYQIYYAALLHDVGMIGVDESILSKKDSLTEEEYEKVKRHSEMGRSALSTIKEYPYLAVGALSHHERYDGRGYPDKLKGEDIPEIARIIAVADSYDAMSSDRSYRTAIPDQKVREEIVKGTGTQFDPNFAKIMLHNIDIGWELDMVKRGHTEGLDIEGDLVCKEYRKEISAGIVITDHITRIRLKSVPEGSEEGKKYIPTFVAFDSLDGHVHSHSQTIKDTDYFEYCEIWFDGHAVATEARKIETNVRDSDPVKRDESIPEESNATVYDVEAVKCGDHLLVTIDDKVKTAAVTVALPDSARYVYLAITGEYCHISEISVVTDETAVSRDYIPRIAEEISYIDRMEGDIPNIQINGFRSDTTAGIPITEDMEISFHTMSLPTARLIWHCPYLVIFHSDDGMVNGGDYREYALVRLDGENWEADGRAENKLIANIQDDFEGWDAWKEINKTGFDCTVNFERRGSRIVLLTENKGVFIKNITTITDGMSDIYVSLTGDQCALTDIHIRN